MSMELGAAVGWGQCRLGLHGVVVPLVLVLFLLPVVVAVLPVDVLVS